MSKLEEPTAKPTSYAFPQPGSWVLSPKLVTAWKQVQAAYLQHKGLWSIVEKPAVTAEEKAKDKEALFLLKASINPNELAKTGNCKSAYELWKKVQENYEGSRQTLQGSVSADWAHFSGIPNEDLITYCGRFEQLLAKLDACEYTVPDDQKFHFFVRS